MRLEVADETQDWVGRDSLRLLHWSWPTSVETAQGRRRGDGSGQLHAYVLPLRKVTPIPTA